MVLQVHEAVEAPSRGRVSSGPVSPYLSSPAKRLLDLAGAAAALVFLLPLLLAVAALVALDSPGGVLFRQERHGLRRRPFRIWKFRSMRAESAASYRQAVLRDPRVTRVGRLLRDTSLDELPQLVNVLAGQMSLVGPRPHPVALDQQFAGLIEGYELRFAARPGLAGWAQVNGHRGPTDTLDTMRRRIERDLHYVRHGSLRLDLAILALAAVSGQAHRNAC